MVRVQNEFEKIQEIAVNKTMELIGTNRYLRKIGEPEAEIPKAPTEWRMEHLESLEMLKQMLEGKIEQIQPSINLHSDEKVSYPKAEELMDVSSTEAEDILESLAREGVLEREFYDKLLTCPECGSMSLDPTLCPRCSSSNIVRKKALEHLSCGYTAPEEEFKEEEGEYVCPKCGKKLEAIGVDYSRVGVFFVCRECGEKFDLSDQLWECPQCSESFSRIEVGERIVYFYRLNEKKKGWLRVRLEFRGDATKSSEEEKWGLRSPTKS